MGQFIGVNDIPAIVSEITSQAEAANGALGAILRTRNRFEGWWQGVLVAGFAGNPWNRKPGWNPEHEDDPADLAVEVHWPVADRRMRYTRRVGHSNKRLDLVVRAGGPRSRLHLVELKWLDGSWSTTGQVAGIAKDAEALRAMKTWGEASGWCMVLAYDFDDGNAVRCALLEGIQGAMSITAPFSIPLATPERSAWVVGIRMA